MNLLVTNNCYGSPILWKYDHGLVDRIHVIDFNTHQLCMDNDLQLGQLPLDLYEIIIKYVMESLLSTRNFDQAYQILTINRRTLFMFYYEIYGHKDVSTLDMLYQISRTFQLADAFYEEYLAMPNASGSGLNAITLTRMCSKKYQKRYDPWDFLPNPEIQRVIVAEEETLESTHMFPGQFHGETVWVRGTEDDGIYTVENVQHPVFIIILSDFTYALIPTRRSINLNWAKFCRFLRRGFGESTGFYFMVKHNFDAESPFIETTELFLEL